MADSLTTLMKRLRPLISGMVNSLLLQLVNNGGIIGRGEKVIRTSTQTLTSGSAAALSFSDEIVATEPGTWDSGTPTRLVATRFGKFRAGGGWAHSPGGTGAYRATVSIVMNGAKTLATSSIVTGVNANLYLSVMVDLISMETGDYIEIMAYQDSGSDKTILAANTNNHSYCYGWLQRAG